MRNGLWLSCALVLAAASAAAAQARPSEAVNPLRGTASTPDYSRGNTIPATTRPFGFNFWTPMTNAAATNWLYRYDHSAIQAFAISHIPSPWLGDFAQLQIMPMLGPLRVDPVERGDAFTHDREVARPYHYRVDLTGSGIRAEIAPSDHGAIMRFTFPRAEQAHILFDTVDAASGELAVDREGRVISGHIDQRNPRMYFYATVDKAIDVVTDPPDGGANAAVGFATQADEVVLLRIATSYISKEQARTHVERELRARSFEQVASEAQADWDQWLGRIEIEGASDAERVTFYSNLYRVGMYPTSMWEDVAGSPKHFSPFSRALRDGKLYTNNGFWDTYRAAWPLYVLLAPSFAGTVIDGFVNVYKDVGWVPRWAGPDALDCMVGSHSDTIFGEAYLKGVSSFDAQAAYESMLKNALVYSEHNNYGRKGNRRSIFLGYVPLEDAGESAAWHLEDTTNDYLISRMAAALGDPAHARYFHSRSLGYASLYSDSVGFFRGRHADGSYRTSDEAFKPNEWGHEFTEGCAWHYVTAATHDPRGMANLYGGQSALAQKLDTVFAASPEFLPGGYVNVIHEMREAFDTGMGQYAHANEPVHSMIYMYDYAGAPARTQALARDALGRLYGPGTDGGGYLGDEDNGQMSAWYVFGALGFYPAAPGQLQYAIGSPLFTKATIHLENGERFVVVARDNSPENRFIQRARLNGVPLERAFLEHAEVAAGGELELEMGPMPSAWGSGAAPQPRSATTTDAAPQPAIDRARSGSASASAENTGAGEVAAKAFDDDSATKWLADADHGYLEYRFANAERHAIDMYTLTSANDEPGRDPTDWTLSGSDDGVSWSIVDTQRGQSFAWRRQTRVFAVARAVPYNMYRLTIERNHGAPLTQLAELELLSDVASERVALGLGGEGSTADHRQPASAKKASSAAGHCAGCSSGSEVRAPASSAGCGVQSGHSGLWGVWFAAALIWLRRTRFWAERT
jgi:predicted alpha-1,2-mannosidase